ncbi:MAG: histidine kinase [Flavobacteriaceae bacterium]
MAKKYFVLVIFCIYQYFNLQAQTPSYYHYTSSDGLASSTVYDIIQADNGFIWFATANGISKFDGNKFTTFRTKEGLNSNSIIALLKRKNGELLAGNFEKGINIIKNDKIENFYYKVNEKRLAISYLMLDTTQINDSKIIAYKRWGKLNVLNNDDTIGHIKNIISANPNSIIKLETLSNGEMIALTTTGLYNYNGGQLSKMHIEGLPDTNFFCFSNSTNGSYLVGSEGMIYRIKNNTIIDSYKADLTGNGDIVALLSDKNNNIWFSIINKGFYKIPDGTKTVINMGLKMGLQNTLVNKYFEDNEGNVWISAFGKGVYCFNNLYLKSYNENDGLGNNIVNTIAKDESGKLLLGTFNGISVLENGRFNRIKNNLNNIFTGYVYSIKEFDHQYYACAAFTNAKIETKNISYKNLKINFINILSFCKLSNGMFLLGSRNNTIHFRKSFSTPKPEPYFIKIFEDNVNENRINQIVEDTEKNIWIGTGLGLCKATISTDSLGQVTLKKTFFKSNDILNARINYIMQDKQNNIWIAGEKGLVRYNLKTDSITSFKTINNYDLSASTSVVFDQKNRIWIGNMKGLYVFDGENIKYLNTQSGLPSDEVLSLYSDLKENKIYIGTSNGISILNNRLFDQYNPTPPDVKVLAIKAGETNYNIDSNLIFNPKEQDVRIDFAAINFASPGTIQYKYQLNDEWKTTNLGILDFVSLKQGVYKLQIMAKAQNTTWGTPTFLSFTILPKFTETIWFNGLIIVVFVLIIMAVITWQMRVKAKKLQVEFELSERINKLKHQALSAMMNPHFISNALNSVQYLVNNHQYQETNDYIAMMAKLMRKNLDTAGSGYILLSDEITRLELYLDIEKLRFQDHFTYEIVTGSSVNPQNLMIPNMIIQPFVENSLWHGIINSGRSGLLSMSFFFEDVAVDKLKFKYLIIKITDNGIGINKAKQHKKEDHISKGITIIEERLKLLSAKMQMPQPIMFEDLSNRNDKSHGTEVIISLPPELYKVKSTT